MKIGMRKPSVKKVLKQEQLERLKEKSKKL